MNPLTLPPRLVIRALDDLHTIALAASAVPDAVAVLRELVEVAAGLERLDRRAGEVLTRVDDLVALGERVVTLDARAADVQNLIDRLLTSVDALGIAAGTLAQAAEPLQGVTERLGVLAERLPGRPRAPRKGP